MEKEKILARLIRHFRLEPHTVTYAESVEMLFVFRYASKVSGHKDVEAVVLEITRLQRELGFARSNRQKLHSVFSICQRRGFAECGKYDTKTLRPPRTRPTHRDFEY